jgi:hypothetical protein
MVNIEKRPMRAAQRRFIDEIAALLAPWGMAPSQARTYGYLLLHQEPVTLDRIAADLQMSKVGAWKAARSLEAFGHICRYGEPGSKRALYGPTDRFETPLAKQSALLGALGAVMQDGATTVTSGGAATRLRAMARFYLATRAAIEQAIADLDSAPSAAAKSAKKR